MKHTLFVIWETTSTRTDVDLTTCLARSFTDSRRGEMNAKNGEEHGRKSGIQTHTNTHRLPSLARFTNSIESTRERPKAKSLGGWIDKQGDRNPRSKWLWKDRLQAKTKNHNRSTLRYDPLTRRSLRYNSIKRGGGFPRSHGGTKWQRPNLISYLSNPRKWGRGTYL